MKDFEVLDRMTVMCQESCAPDMYEQFEELVCHLLNTRGSLSHIHKNNGVDDSCDICNKDLFHKIHKRSI